MGHFTIKEYNSIRLDGIRREGEDLKAFCLAQLKNTYTPEWKSHIYQFILQWLSPKNYVVAHTSGSTGKPKEVRLLKKHMWASAQKTVAFFNLTNDKTALLCLSAHYIAGKMMLVRAFVGGFNLLLVEPTRSPLMHIAESIDFVAMVPLQVYHSITHFNENINSVLIGGGVVSSELKRKLKGLDTCFYESYGMTETVSHVAIREVGKEDGFFKAMSNVIFEQDDRNCLKIVAPDICEGEIVTNDIVKLISQSEFLFLGRYDHIINTGGVKIIPEEVELKLSHCLASPFLISSVPDEKLGEKIVLVLDVQSADAQLPDFSLVLNRYEIPKKVIVVQNFPLTETGKIKRKDVKLLISKC